MWLVAERDEPDKVNIVAARSTFAASFRAMEGGKMLDDERKSRNNKQMAGQPAGR